MDLLAVVSSRRIYLLVGLNFRGFLNRLLGENVSRVHDLLGEALGLSVVDIGDLVIFVIGVVACIVIVGGFIVRRLLIAVGVFRFFIRRLLLSEDVATKRLRPTLIRAASDGLASSICDLLLLGFDGICSDFLCMRQLVRDSLSRFILLSFVNLILEFGLLGGDGIRELARRLFLRHWEECFFVLFIEYVLRLDASVAFESLLLAVIEGCCIFRSLLLSLYRRFFGRSVVDSLRLRFGFRHVRLGLSRQLVDVLIHLHLQCFFVFFFIID